MNFTPMQMIDKEEFKEYCKKNNYKIAETRTQIFISTDDRDDVYGLFEKYDSEVKFLSGSCLADNNTAKSEC